MATPAASASAKILRLGVIHGGKIVEETLVRKRQPVTVGESSKNTLVLPSSAELGPSVKLFDIDAGSYALVFSENMQGRVSVDDNVLDFATLRQQGLARKRGDSFWLPLADKARG